MRQVCKDVGWDGQGFYCMRCGKAGFQTEAQARGHLSQCKSRSIQKGLTFPQGQAGPPLSEMLPSSGCCEEVLPPVAGGRGGVNTYSLGGGAGGAGGGQNVYPLPQTIGYSQGLMNLDRRIGQLENEYNHMLMQRNAPRQDWLSELFQNKGLLIFGLVLLFALLSRSERCSTNCGSSGGGIGGLGSKALTKLTDKAITKSVDSLFKYI